MFGYAFRMGRGSEGKSGVGPIDGKDVGPERDASHHGNMDGFLFIDASWGVTGLA